jgi:glycosyltransferase involved in cell wall biosynthesis
MKRVAVIFESSPFDRKGLFNAVHNRVKALLATGECWVDAYCIHSQDNAFTRSVRHTSYAPHVDNVEIEGITYKMLWYRFSVLDHITLEKLGKRPCLFRKFIKSHVSFLEGYDVVVAHSFTGALFAYEAMQAYGTPYFANWHGSDVHTHPWRVPVILEDTRKVMEAAQCNFFVSNALKDASDRITVNARKEVLYNGVSEDFVPFDPAARAAARAGFGLPSDAMIVGFAGNLSAVKNVISLPEIFKAVSSQFPGNVHFVIAGDGKLRKSLEASLSASMLGNLPAEDMPALMNCIDVLVLPSLNEGLPLVCAEALCCGANVVGSDVGGIAEVIGRGNVVPLGEGFEKNMAEKIVHMLLDKPSQPLPSYISWEKTSEIELSHLQSAELLGKS